MPKYVEIKDIQSYLSLLLLTLVVPIQIGNCTPRGTCTQVGNLCARITHVGTAVGYNVFMVTQ